MARKGEEHGQEEVLGSGDDQGTEADGSRAHRCGRSAELLTTTIIENACEAKLKLKYVKQQPTLPFKL